MSEPNDQLQFLLDGFQELMNDENSHHLSDFMEVSESFTEGYARFVRLGLPCQTIGLAMLNATVNLYHMFGMQQDLPDLFRLLADKIEKENQAH